MYISNSNPNPNPKSQSQPSLDYSDDENHHHDMMIELNPNPNPTHVSSTTSGPHRMGPKKRAETWIQEETRSLISLRREMDSLFNTSKSNKHLWEQISSRMRDRGFDRSPAMCTDKWRNLLKEFKKIKHHNHGGGGGGGGGGCGGGNGCNGSAKMSYYKEIEEILRERIRVSGSGLGSGGVGGYRSPSHSGGDLNHNGKVDSFLHFTDKGIDDDSIAFGPIEGNGRGTLNLEGHSDHEGHPLAITAADAVTGGGVPPPFWRETPTNGDETHSYNGRVIAIKWGDYTRRVGVEGTADAIKDAIRSAFGLRTKRSFWLEDEDQVIRSLDRDMPLATYTLHLDAGVTIKFCYEESDHISYPNQTISHTEEHTFYTEADFREFMHHHGWSFLRELNGYRNIHNMDDLRPDALYRGVS